MIKLVVNALFTRCILCLCWASLGSAIYGQENWESGLSAYWHFNGSLAEIMGDHHGFPQKGSVAHERGGSRQVEQYVTSPFGEGVHLDGEYFIDVPGTAGLFGTLHSISFWVKPEAEGGTILFAGGDSWNVSYKSPGLFLGHTEPGFEPIPAFSIDEEAAWHHVVILVYEVGSQRLSELHVDGKRVGQPRSWKLALGSRALAIGGRPAWASGLFRGDVDEVAIWTGRRLTEKEIAILWNNGNGRALESLLVDQDEDGIPDVWERRKGLSPTDNDSEEDPDGCDRNLMS